MAIISGVEGFDGSLRALDLPEDGKMGERTVEDLTEDSSPAAGAAIDALSQSSQSTFSRSSSPMPISSPSGAAASSPLSKADFQGFEVSQSSVLACTPRVIKSKYDIDISKPIDTVMEGAMGKVSAQQAITKAAGDFRNSQLRIVVGENEFFVREEFFVQKDNETDEAFDLRKTTEQTGQATSLFQYLKTTIRDKHKMPNGTPKSEAEIDRLASKALFCATQEGSKIAHSQLLEHMKSKDKKVLASTDTGRQRVTQVIVDKTRVTVCGENHALSCWDKDQEKLYDLGHVGYKFNVVRDLFVVHADKSKIG